MQPGFVNKERLPAWFHELLFNVYRTGGRRSGRCTASSLSPCVNSPPGVIRVLRVDSDAVLVLSQDKRAVQRALNRDGEQLSAMRNFSCVLRERKRSHSYQFRLYRPSGGAVGVVP